MKRPSHAAVVAYLALFVALSGSSYAAISIQANSVGSQQLKASSVGSAELQKAAVGAAASRLGGGGTASPGSRGERGEQGLPGADGAPDTAAQTLEKLWQMSTSSGAMLLTVMSDGDTTIDGDQRRFSMLAVYDVP